jgi:hypothetical protein
MTIFVIVKSIYMILRWRCVKMHKNLALKNSFVFALAAVICFVVLTTGVSAEHTATITITPNVANCDELGNTFTIHVQNNAGSGNPILQVEIYKALEGLSDFNCGPAPTGWSYLPWPGEDRCIYVTGLSSAYKIQPGSTLDFTFDAVMSSDTCSSEFIVVTVDDAYPQGDRDTNPVYVKIDCTPPVISKIVGDPKIAGDVFDYWVTSLTDIDLEAADNDDQCDLGVDYCRWRVTLDGVVGDWVYEQNGYVLDWTIHLMGDSNHYLEVECYDLAGNPATLTEMDKVDNTPPVTTKEISEPKKVVPGDDPNEFIEWVDTVTTITLNPVDPDPTTHSCNIGVDKTWYANVLAECYDSCYDPANFCEPVLTFPYEQYKDCIDYYQIACEKEMQGETRFGSWYECVEFYAHDNCGVAPEWHLYDGNPISKDEESCHILQFFSVDEIGNVEDMNTNCFFVDKTPPEVFKDNGQAILGSGEPLFITPENPNGEFHWLTTDMPIEFDCVDPEPHPAGDEQLCFKVSYDYPEWDYITEEYCDDTPLNDEDYCCVDVSGATKYYFYFQEESMHNIEYYCIDAVEKDSDVHVQYYKVDDTPPSITKTMLGSYLGDCPPEDQSDVCYVADNGQSGVHIAIQDGGEICAVDQTQCGYNLWWMTDEKTCEAEDYDWDGSKCLVEGGFFNGEEGKDILFTEDSTHDLYLSCWDALGNTVNDIETFLVDSTPPVTTKTYGTPTVVNGNYRWITSATPITLTATDAKVGVDDVIYRVTPLFIADEICAEACEYKGSGGWNEIEDDHITFTIPQDSCHLIEFYSVDKLGNTELINKQCVFVDNKAPETTKVVGDPKVEKEKKVYISQQTPIEMRCADQQPHPVDQVTLKYRYRFAETCEGLPEATWSEFMTYEDAIHFTEDSCHEIEFYCVDALGNEETHQFEIDVVDTKAPVISVGVEGPWYGDCPWGYTGDDEEDCFLDGVTNLTVEVVDPQPHPVDDIVCRWAYTVNDGNPIFGGQGLGATFKVHFPEESNHFLTIQCQDGLGNTVIWNNYFAVDKTPPSIDKQYGLPYYDAVIDNYYAEWITSDTPIYGLVADAGPHKSGIAEVKYRTTRINDEYCKQYKEVKLVENGGPYLCENAVGDGEWTTVDPEDYDEFVFNIKEDSCHLIEIYAEDNVEKSSLHKQCVFVDNQAPDPIKTVGEPKWMWDGSDAYYYDIADKCWKNEIGETLDETQCKNDAWCIECWRTTLLTPIYLECNDPIPHPVDHETVCFNVEWDADDVTKDYCQGELTYNAKYNKSFCCVDHEMVFNFGETTEHELEYYCIDALGNTNEKLDIEKFKVEDTAFNITLNKKWNLISVPVFLLEDNPEAVFYHIKDKVIGVWTYDPTNEMCGDDWCFWIPGDAGDNIPAIEPGWGYWVLMEDGAVLEIGGSLMRPGPVGMASKEIVPGWNLIGYYGADGLLSYNGPYGNGGSAYCELYSLGEDIWDKEFTGLYTYWEPWNPNQWEELSLHNNMDPGAGYWLATPQSGLYTPSTICGGQYS